MCVAFGDPPPSAAWRHQDGRSGFEIAFFRKLDDGWQIEGSTTAIEDGHGWAVAYAIRLDRTWATRSAYLSGRSASGSHSSFVEADGAGHWLIDGAVAPHLEGCLDVDLESSAMTNAFPVHRIGQPVGGRASCPAAYIRARDLSVERLEQTYLRAPDVGPHQCYDYTAPAFGFACRLEYDESGLVLAYPGIAVRAG